VSSTNGTTTGRSIEIVRPSELDGRVAGICCRRHEPERILGLPIIDGQRANAVEL